MNHKIINKLVIFSLFLFLFKLFNINYLQIVRILKTFIIGFYFAYLYHIMVNQLTKIFKNKTFAHLFCIISIIIIFMIMMSSFSWFVKKEFSEIIIKLKEIMSTLLTNFSLDLSSVVPYLINYINIVVSKSTLIVPIIIIIPFISIYFIVYFDDILSFFKKMNYIKKHIPIIQKIDMQMKNYIINISKIILMLSSMSFIVFLIFKIENPFFLAIFYGISDIIPIIGPLISGLIIGLIVMIDYPQKLIWIIVAMCVMQLIEEQIIVPKIHENNLELNPLLIIFGMMVFGELMGIFGIFFTVPLLVIIDTISKEVVEKFE